MHFIPFPYIYIADVIMFILVSIFMPVKYLTQANHQLAVA